MLIQIIKLEFISFLFFFIFQRVNDLAIINIEKYFISFELYKQILSMLQNLKYKLIILYA